MLIVKNIFFLIPLFLIPYFSEAAIIYKLTTDPGDPQTANVSVDTSNLGMFSLEKPRTATFTEMPQVPLIECVTDSKKHKVNFGQEVRCDEIIWSIHFDRLQNLEINVSVQRNLYAPSAGWWVLFEWNAIPRIKGYSSIQICARQIPSSSHEVCRPLPRLDQPPLIMAWGKTSAQTTESDTIFNIYSDDNQRLRSSLNWSNFLSQYNYLKQLFSTPQSSSSKELDLILVGIDASMGTIGGAAGNQAFIANYVVKNNQVSKDSMVRLHWVSGHEIFHILTPYEYPLWMSESLAQYYGYKSFIGAEIVSQTPIDMWNSHRNKNPHASAGLYQAHEKVVNEKDMSYYGLFYLKGAAFWQEFDRVLTNNGASLDEYIGILSRANPSHNSKLSIAFTDTMEKLIGKDKYMQLISRYL